MFSIIITACYTGSIIAFVTLPVFPDTIDSIQDLLDGFYRVGTLCKVAIHYTVKMTKKYDVNDFCLCLLQPKMAGSIGSAIPLTQTLGSYSEVWNWSKTLTKVYAM